MIPKWLKQIVSWNKSEIIKKSDEEIKPGPEDIHYDVYDADADDLILLVDNEIDLYKNRLMPMYENLTRKKLRGVYDPNLAPKLFRYVVDEAAKRWYERMVEWADDGKSIVHKPTKEVKQEAAEELARRFESSFENKEYDFMTELEEKYKKRMPKKVKEPEEGSPEWIKKQPGFIPDVNKEARKPKPVEPPPEGSAWEYDPTTDTWELVVIKKAEENIEKQALEFNEENVRAEMSDALGITPDGLNITERDNVFEIDTGDSGEYQVVENEDVAEKMAIDLVKEELESEPELFNKDWLQTFIEISDTDKRQIALDLVEYINDMDEDEIIERAELEIPENISDEEREKIIDQAREDLQEKEADEIEKKLNDPIGYFVNEQGMYSIDDLLKQPFMAINITEAASDAIAVDGWQHFLATYDGNSEETKSGFVYWRTN